LLGDVARDDQQQSARLRLVCIYTSEPDLAACGSSAEPCGL
jgi:hypothetical protein